MTEHIFKVLCDGITADVKAKDKEMAVAKALAWMIDGSWPRKDKTWWIISESEEGAKEEYTVDPRAPKCKSNGESHQWCREWNVLGGVKSNPGYFGSNGSSVCIDVCSICGRYRRSYSMANEPQREGSRITSIEYGESDEGSRRWLARSTGVMN